VIRVSRDGVWERGTITLWMLGCCLMLFAVGGISVDLWRSFSVRRSLAAAADAAALSGASAIDEERFDRRPVSWFLSWPACAPASAPSSTRPPCARSVSADAQSVTVAGAVGLTLLRQSTIGARHRGAATAMPRRPS
jgi:hypothetical protein